MILKQLGHKSEAVEPAASALLLSAAVDGLERASTSSKLWSTERNRKGILLGFHYTVANNYIKVK